MPAGVGDQDEGANDLGARQCDEEVAHTGHSLLQSDGHDVGEQIAAPKQTNKQATMTMCHPT